MISKDNDEWRCGIDSSCCISLFSHIKRGGCDAGGKDFGGYGYCDTHSSGGWALREVSRLVGIAGIDRKTLLNWLKRGEREKSGCTWLSSELSPESFRDEGFT